MLLDKRDRQSAENRSIILALNIADDYFKAKKQGTVLENDVQQKDKELYVFDEIYQRGMLNTDIYNAISEKGYVKERITADSAEPKSIDELKLLGLRRIKPALKGKDSINNGIQFIQQYKIIINPKCVNFITEIQNYMWDKDKFDNKLNKPIDDFNHLMDALRYAMEDLKKADTVNFGYNKIM